MVDYTSSSIFLLNPFKKQRIELPPLTAFPDILDFRPDQVGKEYIYRDLFGDEDERSLKDLERFYVQKVILSTDPTASDCIAMAICGDVSHLAFCKPGDETWTLIPQPENHGYDDIVFWRNKFYAVDSRGSVVVCDIGGSPPNETLFIQGPSTWIRGITRYLVVDPSGELLLVVKHHFPDPADDNEEDNDGDGDDDQHEDEGDEDEDNDSDYEDHDDEYEDNDNDYEDHDEDKNDLDDYKVTDDTPYKTSHFDIYKLDKESKNWTKVNGLGNYMLFLGSNRGVCLLARDGFSQCKRNCINFVDDYLCGYEEGRMGGHDLGVFNFEDNSIKPFPCCPDDTLLIWPPPIWVTPSLPLSQNI